MSLPFAFHTLTNPSDETRHWLSSAMSSFGMRVTTTDTGLDVTLPGTPDSVHLRFWEGPEEALTLSAMLNWMNYLTAAQLDERGLDAFGRPLPELSVCVP